MGKDRENTFEFKASAAGPCTAPVEHLEQTQCLVWHVKMVSTLLSAPAQKLEKNPLDLIRDTGLLFLQLRLLLERQTDTKIVQDKHLKSCARAVLIEPLCFD